MANVMRKIKDFKADPAAIREFAVDASVTIEVGDLLWYTGDDVRPMSHSDIWTGTLAGSEGKAAEKFAGVAMSAKSSAVADKVRVACRGVFKFPLDAAATAEIGDLVKVSRDGSSNFFLDQTVTKMTNTPANQGSAIGIVAQREATAVNDLLVEFQSSVVEGGGAKAFLTS